MGIRRALEVKSEAIRYLNTTSKPLIERWNLWAGYCAWGCFRVFERRARPFRPPEAVSGTQHRLQQNQQPDADHQHDEASRRRGGE